MIFVGEWEDMPYFPYNSGQYAADIRNSFI